MNGSFPGASSAVAPAAASPASPRPAASRFAAAWSLSWLMTRRDWRAGELRLLLAALLVAVAAIASVGLFVDRMKQALDQEAAQLIGADLVVAGDEPPAPALASEAARRGLRTARTATFPSMVLAGDRTLLASVKAASGDYPLRGALRVADAPGAADGPASGMVGPGEAWVDQQLLQSLGVAVGDRVQLGGGEFRIRRIITLEPDRGSNFVNLAPRILIAAADLPATGLVQPTSRIAYRLMIAGDAAEVARFGAWAQAYLGRGERIETIESGRPELRTTLDRAQGFLSLVSMLTALIAAVAIGLAARRFALRHMDACAVMRAIGLSQRRLTAALLLELLWLGLAGGVLGVALGWGVHRLLVFAIAPMIAVPLPAPSAWPIARSIVAGLVLLLGFGGWPFARLARIPPLRVLRRDLGAPGGQAWLTATIPLVAFAALLWWAAGDRMLALIALGGFAAGAALFAALAWGAVIAVGPLRRVGSQRIGPALRLALASWSRRRGATVAQTVALAVGLMALTLLTVTRTDLLDSWRRASPADAPNRIVINIQPDQKDAVAQRLRDEGARDARLFPMIRGRLVSINGRAVDPEAYEAGRARRLIEREFNLSYGDAPPAHNRTVEGRWIDPAKPEVSGEIGLMQTLNLRIGDELGFDIAGEVVEVRLVGGRKVAWDSMQVNFFMIASPSAIGDRPQSWITAYHQPPDRADASLVRQFPNLTVFDTGHIVRQIQQMLDQVIQAVEFLFALTLLAGVVVLYAALAGSRDERVREAALMRALGASRGQLVRALLWELGIAGGVAGLMASLGALVIGWSLAARVFDFAYQPRWEAVALGIAVGAVLAIGTGWLGLRDVLRAPPIRTLRES
ncbi:MAG: FtsX-like permease family protein [Burkholderiaceae bacterium]